MNKKQLSDAAAYLSEQDEQLSVIIAKINLDPIVPGETDSWWRIVDSIVSQQLSVKAADTILARLEAITPKRPTPEDILSADPETLRSVGLSWAKVKYLQDLAQRVNSGDLKLKELQTLPDDDVIAKLTEVKGIGRWTAEMYLIFHLGRPDVLPIDDLGFREATKRLYDLSERPSGAEFQEIGERWRPYRSIAARYLWKSLDQV